MQYWPERAQVRYLDLGFSHSLLHMERSEVVIRRTRVWVGMRMRMMKEWTRDPLATTTTYIYTHTYSLSLSLSLSLSHPRLRSKLPLVLCPIDRFSIDVPLPNVGDFAPISYFLGSARVISVRTQRSLPRRSKSTRHSRSLSKFQ